MGLKIFVIVEKKEVKEERVARKGVCLYVCESERESESERVGSTKRWFSINSSSSRK